MNTYGYVGGNPLRSIDKYGLLDSWEGPYDYVEAIGDDAPPGGGAIISGSPLGGAASALFWGGSYSTGVINESGRSCRYIQTCRRYMLGGAFTATASVGLGFKRKPKLCSGTSTSKKIFGTGGLGLVGRLSLNFGESSTTVSTGGGFGASFGVGYEECETTLVCNGPEPCSCKSK